MKHAFLAVFFPVAVLSWNGSACGTERTPCSADCWYSVTTYDENCTVAEVVRERCFTEGCSLLPVPVYLVFEAGHAPSHADLPDTINQHMASPSSSDEVLHMPPTTLCYGDADANTTCSELQAIFQDNDEAYQCTTNTTVDCSQAPPASQTCTVSVMYNVYSLGNTTSLEEALNRSIEVGDLPVVKFMVGNDTHHEEGETPAPEVPVETLEWNDTNTTTGGNNVTDNSSEVSCATERTPCSAECWRTVTTYDENCSVAEVALERCFADTCASVPVYMVYEAGYVVSTGQHSNGTALMTLVSEHVDAVLHVVPGTMCYGDADVNTTCEELLDMFEDNKCTGNATDCGNQTCALSVLYNFYFLGNTTSLEEALNKSIEAGDLPVVKFMVGNDTHHEDEPVVPDSGANETNNTNSDGDEVSCTTERTPCSAECWRTVKTYSENCTAVEVVHETCFTDACVAVSVPVYMVYGTEYSSDLAMEMHGNGMELRGIISDHVLNATVLHVAPLRQCHGEVNSNTTSEELLDIFKMSNSSTCTDPSNTTNMTGCEACALSVMYDFYFLGNTTSLEEALNRSIEAGDLPVVKFMVGNDTHHEEGETPAPEVPVETPEWNDTTNVNDTNSTAGNDTIGGESNKTTCTTERTPCSADCWYSVTTYDENCTVAEVVRDRCFVDKCAAVLTPVYLVYEAEYDDTAMFHSNDAALALALNKALVGTDEVLRVVPRTLCYGDADTNTTRNELLAIFKGNDDAYQCTTNLSAECSEQVYAHLAKSKPTQTSCALSVMYDFYFLGNTTSLEEALNRSIEAGDLPVVKFMVGNDTHHEVEETPAPCEPRTETSPCNAECMQETVRHDDKCNVSKVWQNCYTGECRRVPVYFMAMGDYSIEHIRRMRGNESVIQGALATLFEEAVLVTQIVLKLVCRLPRERAVRGVLTSERSDSSTCVHFADGRPAGKKAGVLASTSNPVIIFEYVFVTTIGSTELISMLKTVIANSSSLLFTSVFASNEGAGVATPPPVFAQSPYDASGRFSPSLALFVFIITFFLIFF